MERAQLSAREREIPCEWIEPTTTSFVFSADPFPGKRALAGDVATHEALQAPRESEAVELEVVSAVKRAYVDLWLAYERLAVLAREKSLVERFTHVVEERYGSPADVLRAQVRLCGPAACTVCELRP